MKEKYICNLGRINELILKEKIEPIKNNSPKPWGGLWTCRENTPEGYSWKDWCEHEEPEWINKYDTIITLKDDARILVINSKEAYKNNIKYTLLHGININDIPPSFNKEQLMFTGLLTVDYESLKEKYDMIDFRISEYSELYYDMYGLDCDSCLILNPDCIEEIINPPELIKEYEENQKRKNVESNETNIVKKQQADKEIKGEKCQNTLDKKNEWLKNDKKNHKRKIQEKWIKERRLKQIQIFKTAEKVDDIQKTSMEIIDSCIKEKQNTKSAQSDITKFSERDSARRRTLTELGINLDEIDKDIVKGKCISFEEYKDIFWDLQNPENIYESFLKALVEKALFENTDEKDLIDFENIAEVKKNKLDRTLDVIIDKINFICDIKDINSQNIDEKDVRKNIEFILNSLIMDYYCPDEIYEDVLFTNVRNYEQIKENIEKLKEYIKSQGNETLTKMLNTLQETEEI